VGITAGSREVPGRKPVTRDNNNNNIIIIIIIIILTTTTTTTTIIIISNAQAHRGIPFIF
jgi:hypothetical protein